MTGAGEEMPDDLPLTLRELIAALTVEVKGMAEAFKKSRRSARWQWVVSLGVIAALGVGGYAIYGNHNATSCVNTNLGARSAPSAALTAAQLVQSTAQVADAQAQAANAKAQAALQHAQTTTSGALFKLLSDPPAKQAADYKVFFADFAHSQAVAATSEAALDAYVTATNEYVTATDSYAAALQAVQTAQVNHPLGKC